MNEMAMVEYLLKLYARYDQEAINAQECEDDYEAMYYSGKADLAHTIIQERFGCQIKETDTEYRAYNRICSVRVLK